jgi:hypothetical protein
MDDVPYGRRVLFEVLRVGVDGRSVSNMPRL